MAAMGAPAAWGDGLMLIQAGAFWMGSDTDGENERPRHRVFVKDFWMDRHKVTNREFAAFPYEHRGAARGHHFIGFRCATSEDLGGR